MFQYSTPPTFDCAEALSASVVSFCDPEAKAISPPRWEKERAVHKETFELVHGCFGITEIANWTSGQPVTPFFLQTVAKLRATVAQDDTLKHLASAAARRVLAECRLLFSVQDFSAPVPLPKAKRSDYSGSVKIIIPFRAVQRHDGRLRNLLTCLKVLSKQTSGPVDVIVVEDDDRPRNREAIRQYDVSYIHMANPGKFNKAAAINLGANFRALPDEVYCVLDGDAYLDETFVDRSIGSLIDFDCKVLFPYTDMFFIQPEDTERILDSDFSSAMPIAGYVSRSGPGGCFWVRRETFDAVGGFDAGFSGWGGEDRDFYSRVEAVEKIVRLPGVFAHLFHERAPEIIDALSSDSPWQNDYTSKAAV
ncbi:galactosyltransferase-related protein (plasmid) [Rhizobium leguminosarum]